MSEASDYLNRRTTEVAVTIVRTFKSDSLDEMEGAMLLHSMVAVCLGSCLVQPEPGEGVITTTAPPLLERDATQVLEACRSIVGQEGGDGDCICALLQAVLFAMRPALLEAVEECLEAKREPN